MTILTVYTTNGTVARCDARCHNAKETICKCICSGAFHGVGHIIAREERMRLTDDEIIQTAKEMFGEGNYLVRRKPQQKDLFA